jgi:hypothetical protein
MAIRNVVEAVESALDIMLDRGFPWDTAAEIIRQEYGVDPLDVLPVPKAF